jgi:hypothetical protein
MNITSEKYPEFVSLMFDHVLKDIFNLPEYQFRIIQRTKEVNPRHLILGYINLKKKLLRSTSTRRRNARPRAQIRSSARSRTKSRISRSRRIVRATAGI